MLACTDAVNVVNAGQCSRIFLVGRTNDCSIQADPQVRSAPS